MESFLFFMGLCPKPHSLFEKSEPKTLFACGAKFSKTLKYQGFFCIITY